MVRGYDYKAWERLHPPSRRAKTHINTRGGVSAMRTAANTSERENPCGACVAEEERPKATDLVLVIHGQVRHFYLETIICY